MFDEAFNRAFLEVFTYKHIHLIKNWNVFKNDRCMLFSVENEIGNVLCLKIPPRGLGVNIKVQNVDMYIKLRTHGRLS